METLLFVYGLAGYLLPLGWMSALGWVFLAAAVGVLWWLRRVSWERVEPAGRDVRLDELVGGERQ